MISNVIEKYEKEQLGLKITLDKEAPACLSLSIDSISKRDYETLCYDWIEISRYVLFLKKQISREKAWRKWAYQKLDEVTAHTLSTTDLSGLGFTQQELVAKHSGDMARQLNKFIRTVDFKITSLEGIPEQVSILGEAIRDMKYVKYRNEKNND